MAEINDFIDPKAEAQVKTYINSLGEIVKQYEQIFDGAVKINAATGNVLKSQKGVSDAQKQANEVSKEAARLAREQASAAASLDKQRQAALNSIAKQAAKEKDLVAAINMEVRSINDAQRQNKALNEVKKRLDLTTEAGKNKLKEYNKILDKNTEFIRENSTAAGKQAMNIGNYKSALEGLPGVYGRVGAAASTAANAMKAILLNPVILAITAVIALGAGMVAMVKDSMAFSKAVSELAAITGAAGEDLNALKENAKNLGAQYGKTGEEIVNAMKLVGSAKPELLSNIQALSDMTESVIVLSKASGLDLAESTSAVTTIMNQFRLGAEDANRAINVLAAGSKFGAVEVDYLKQSIVKVGTIAASAGLSIEQTTAAMELFGEMGVRAEIAGTGFKSILGKLQADTENYTNGVFDLNKAIDNNQKISNNNLELQKKFGAEFYGLAGILLQGKDRFNSLADAVTGSNTAFEQMAIATDNLSGDTEKMGGAWDRLKKSMEDGDNILSGIARKFVQFGTYLINDFTVFLKKVSYGFEVVSYNVQYVGSLVTAFGESAKVTFSAFGKAWDALTSGNIKEVANSFNGVGASISNAFSKDKFDQAWEAQKKIKQENKALAESLKKTNEPETEGNVDTSTEKQIRAAEKLKDEKIKFENEYQDELQKSLIEGTKIASDEYAKRNADFDKSLQADLDASAKLADEELKALQDYNAALLAEQVASAQRIADANINILRKQLATGQSEEEYSQAVFELDKQGVQSTIDGIKLLLKSTAEGTARRQELLTQLANAQQNLDNITTDNFINNENLKQAKLQETLQQIQNLGGLAFDFVSELYDRQAQKYEEAKQKELAADGDNETKKSVIEEKYAKKAAELKRKQAIADKLGALFQIAMNTAIGVTNATSKVVTIPLVPFIIAAGALQAAAVLAKPIPAYKDGVKNAPRGLALVGEAGAELVEKNNRMQLIDSPSLVNLAGGETIYKNADTQKILASRKISPTSNDQGALVQTIVSSNEKLIRAIKTKKELYISADGAEITEREGGQYTHYFNKKVRWLQRQH